MLHNYMKQLTWELLNRRVDQFISTKSSRNLKIAKFDDNKVPYYDISDENDYEFVVHTASDRAIGRIIKKHNLFDGSPYISCSLINTDLATFRVNPSVLQASILIEFPAKAVMYSIGRDIGSPTNKYHTKQEQNVFFKKLNQQTFFANVVDTKLREIARQENIIGTANWSNITTIVEKISASALKGELSSAFQKKRES